MMSEPSLLQRLKERKLVQWALAYLAGGFVVLQVLDAVTEPLALSVVVQRAILVFLAFGFLLTLVLAWYHGEKGQQRVSGPELLMVAALMVVAGVVVSALGGEGIWMERAAGPRTVALEEDRPGVAVLLCDNFSPNPEDAFRAQGIHEEILLRLESISGLRSIGRTSVLRFAENPPDVSEIAAALNVGFVGECSVLKDPDRSQIRVTFQLLDSSGAQVWADSFDRDLTVGNLFDIQSDVASRVAQAIGASLTAEEQDRIQQRPTNRLDAYELYLLGRHYWNQFTEDGLRRSIERFQGAIALDSSFAPAYAGLADAYLLIGLGHGTQAVDPSEVIPRARAAVRKALDLSPDLVEGLAILAIIRFAFDFKYVEAERLLERAIELAPNSGDTHERYGLFLMTLGRFEEALEANDRALELDPLSASAAADRGFIMLRAGRSEEALSIASEGLRSFPGFPVFQNLKGCAHLARGEYPEAIASLQLASELSPGSPLPSAYLAFALARSGDDAAAGRILDDLLALSEQRYVNPMEIGYVYLGLGQDEEALTWLEQAVENPLGWVVTFPYRPGVERLQSNPRYQALLRRMNLTGQR